MKRTHLVLATVMAGVFLPVLGAGSAYACQYCRMAMEDSEAGQMVTDNRGGSFALDSAIAQYQPAPVSADLKTAPTLGSVATNAGALTAPAAVGAVVHRPVLAPPPASVPAVAKVSVKVDAAAPSSMNAAVAHFTDICLLGLVAAGGVFCWRTRRTPQGNP